VIGRYADTAIKIADLIVGKDAPTDLRTQCINAAQVSVRVGTARREDMPAMLRAQAKPARDAATKLRKVLDRLQRVLANPDLHKSLQPDGSGIKPKRLTAWRERAVAFRRHAKGKAVNVDMLLKVSAAESAFRLHRVFNKKIAITPGSTFIKTAALLYGKPKANLQNACRIVISRWSRQH
jgi:hypothetical protein